MPRQWKELEIEKMLDYRDQGMTEPKIAERLSLVFMRNFTASAVNRKIRDLKRSGYIEQNTHNGRWSNSLGNKRIVLQKEERDEKKARKRK
jgi:DNA-binding IclR family transcriptional regulator